VTGRRGELQFFILLFNSCCSLWSIGHPCNIVSLQFPNFIDGRQDPFEGGSARRKAATYTGQHKHRINADMSCLKPRNHCDRPIIFMFLKLSPT
jgi:hypothetical protein